MSLVSLYEPPEGVPRFGLLPQESRSNLIGRLERCRLVEVAVIGGGVHGAAIAHAAAQAGLKTVLLDEQDYDATAYPLILGGENSISGVLRSLFSSSVRWFEKSAPSILRPNSLAVGSSATLSAACLVKARLLLAQVIPSSGIGRSYTIASDALAREFILAARQEGALCLNHVRVTSRGLSSNDQGTEDTVSVGWHDLATGNRGSFQALTTVQATGITSASFGRVVEVAGECDLCEFHRLSNMPEDSTTLSINRLRHPILAPVSTPGCFAFSGFPIHQFPAAVRTLLNLLHRSLGHEPTYLKTPRCLPSSGLLNDATKEFTAKAEELGIGKATIMGAVSRLGSKVRFINPARLPIIAERYFPDEIDLYRTVEQVENVLDLVRRLGVEGHELVIREINDYWCRPPCSKW